MNELKKLNNESPTAIALKRAANRLIAFFLFLPILMFIFGWISEHDFKFERSEINAILFMGTFFNWGLALMIWLDKRRTLRENS